MPMKQFQASATAEGLICSQFTEWLRISSLIYRTFAVTALLALGTIGFANAKTPTVTVDYQPMVSDGLAARHPFEAWFVFDKPADPAQPGYALPKGATITFTFPKAFTPHPGFLDSALLYGWAQNAIPVKYTMAEDQRNKRVITIKLGEDIAVTPLQKPGLKAIHLHTDELNPSKAGEYPIAITFSNAGELSGTSKAIAHITANPVPNIAAYNQLHGGRNENWQHVKAGEEAPIPIDFLVNLPNDSRSVISLNPVPEGGLSILSDGKPIGAIKATGVLVTLIPERFGPGFARLGIIRVHAKAGDTSGTAQIVAALNGGTRYTITLVVEP